MTQDVEQDARMALLQEYGSNVRNWYIVLLGLALAFFSVIQARYDLQSTGLLEISLILLLTQVSFVVVRITVHGQLAERTLKISSTAVGQGNEPYVVRLHDAIENDFKSEYYRKCGYKLGSLRWWIVWTISLSVLGLVILGCLRPLQFPTPVEPRAWHGGFWALLCIAFVALAARELWFWRGLKKWYIHKKLEEPPTTASGEPLKGKDAEEAAQTDVFRYLQRIAKENFWIGLFAMILSALAALMEMLSQSPASAVQGCVLYVTAQTTGETTVMSSGSTDSLTMFAQVFAVVVGTILGFALTLLNEKWQRRGERARLIANLTGEIGALKERLERDLVPAMELEKAGRVESSQVGAESYSAPYEKNALQIAVGKLDLLPRDIHPLILRVSTNIAALERYPHLISLNPNSPILNNVARLFEAMLKETITIVNELESKLANFDS